MIEWYVVPDTNPTLPFPSAFTSLDWEKFPWTVTGPGEVYGASRTYNGQGPKLGADGSHVCGTAEDFANGCELDESLPPVLYNADGLPLCCGPPEQARGGVVIGGTAEVFEGGAVIPGTTCATATEGALNTPLLVKVLAGTEGWIRYPVSPGGFWSIRTTSDRLPTAFVYDGADCPTKTLAITVALFTDCQSLFVSISGPYVWVQLTGVGEPDREFTVEFSDSLCV